MNNDSKVVISAAFDGECSDIAELRKALSTDEGREVLASFLLIRTQIAADDLSPYQSFVLNESSWIEENANGASQNFFSRLRMGWISIAALTTFALAITFWIGTTWRSQEINVKPASEVIASQVSSPSSVSASTQTGNARSLISEAPPKPARTMRYVPGTEWNSGY